MDSRAALNVLTVEQRSQNRELRRKRYVVLLVWRDIVSVRRRGSCLCACRMSAARLWSRCSHIERVCGTTSSVGRRDWVCFDVV
jgi:hypothetical protein